MSSTVSVRWRGEEELRLFGEALQVVAHAADQGWRDALLLCRFPDEGEGGLRGTGVGQA